MNVRIHPAAEQEILEAAYWYADVSPPLDEEFLAAISDCLEQIARSPRRFGFLETIHVRRQVRRAILRRFPYIIIYRELVDQVLVVAVSHTRRHPTYWHRRLREK